MRYERDRWGVVRRDGLEVAHLRAAWFRSRARATIGPFTWEFSLRHGEYAARRGPDPVPLIRMSAPALLGRAVQPESGPRWQLTMRGFSHTWVLVRDGVEVAVLGPRRNWTSRIVLDSDGAVTDEEATFFLWVARDRTRGD